MTNRALKSEETRASNAVQRLESRIHDAKSVGAWEEVGRLERLLQIASTRQRSLYARIDVEERRRTRKIGL